MRSKASQKIAPMNFLSSGIGQMDGIMDKKMPELPPIGRNVKITSLSGTLCPKKILFIDSKKSPFWA